MLDGVEGEMGMRRSREYRRARWRSGGLYVLCISAGNRCCTQEAERSGGVQQ